MQHFPEFSIDDFEPIEIPEPKTKARSVRVDPPFYIRDGDVMREANGLEWANHPGEAVYGTARDGRLFRWDGDHFLVPKKNGEVRLSFLAREGGQ